MNKTIICWILVILLMCAGCGNSEVTGTVVAEESYDVVTITESGSFGVQECEARGLKDKVIMLESKFCGHCRATLPLFMDACSEFGITPIVLDLAEEQARDEMFSYGIQVQYTPTFVFGCDYYVGVMTKEEYIERLSDFMERD